MGTRTTRRRPYAGGAEVARDPEPSGAAAAIFIVMGVSGCGKSTVGRMLADRLGAQFIDGDDLHPPSNIAKMSAGAPLDDDDRAPWLNRVGEVLALEARRAGRSVGACSALRRRYRERLIAAAGAPIRFIHLTGGIDLIGERLAARGGHFMPTSLLESQFAALEAIEADEPATAYDIGPPPEEIVARIVAEAIV